MLPGRSCIQDWSKEGVEHFNGVFQSKKDIEKTSRWVQKATCVLVVDQAVGDSCRSWFNH